MIRLEREKTKVIVRTVVIGTLILGVLSISILIMPGSKKKQRNI